MAGYMKVIYEKFAEGTSLKDVKSTIKRAKEGHSQTNFLRYAEEALLQSKLQKGESIAELITFSSDAANGFEKPWSEKRLTKLSAKTAELKELQDKQAAKEKAAADKLAAKEKAKADKNSLKAAKAKPTAEPVTAAPAVPTAEPVKRGKKKT